MKAVVQRVSQATVSVGGRVISEIQQGLMVLLGVQRGDTMEDVKRMAVKILKLRIHSDASGKMNLDTTQAGGSFLVVSQFTLIAETKKGNRPSFENASPPAEAELLYLAFLKMLEEETGKPVACGVFGADMQVSLTNNGPVTLILQSRDL